MADDTKWGIAHIHASFNNTIMTVTDETGAETLAKSSGGSVVKQNRDEASPYAAMQMAEQLAENVLDQGIEKVHVRVRGPVATCSGSPGPARRPPSGRWRAPASRSAASRTSPRSPRRDATTEEQRVLTMSTDFDVEFIERGDRESLFVVRNITPAFANGIRRAILADVPTLSIEDVRFVENSSVMFDEQIAPVSGWCR